jgi:hypothetical protein
MALYKDYQITEPPYPPLVVLFDSSVVQLSGAAQRPLCMGRAVVSTNMSTPVTDPREPAWMYIPKEGQESLGPVSLEDLAGYVEMGVLQGSVQVHLRGDSASRYDLTTLLQKSAQTRKKEAAAAPPPTQNPIQKPPAAKPKPEPHAQQPHPKKSPITNSPQPAQSTSPMRKGQPEPVAAPPPTPPLDKRRGVEKQQSTETHTQSAPAAEPIDLKKTTPWRGSPIQQQAPAPPSLAQKDLKEYFNLPTAPPPPVVQAPPAPAPPTNYVIPKQVGSAWKKPLQNAPKPGEDTQAGKPTTTKANEPDQYPDLGSEGPQSQLRNSEKEVPHQPQQKKESGRGQGQSHQDSGKQGRGGRGGHRNRGGRMDPGLLNFKLPDPNAQSTYDE